MYAFLVFFVPSIIGIKIIDSFNKGLTLKNTIYTYIILFYISFICELLIIYNIFGVTKDVFQEINTNLILFMQTAIIALAINIVMAFIGLVVQKNIQFKLEVVNDKNKKSTTADKKTVKKISKTASKTNKKTKNK